MNANKEEMNDSIASDRFERSLGFNGAIGPQLLLHPVNNLFYLNSNI